jgi:hypothetical protein
VPVWPARAVLAGCPRGQVPERRVGGEGERGRRTRAAAIRGASPAWERGGRVTGPPATGQRSSRPSLRTAEIVVASADPGRGSRGRARRGGAGRPVSGRQQCDGAVVAGRDEAVAVGDQARRTGAAAGAQERDLLAGAADLPHAHVAVAAGGDDVVAAGAELGGAELLGVAAEDADGAAVDSATRGRCRPARRSGCGRRWGSSGRCRSGRCGRAGPGACPSSGPKLARGEGPWSLLGQMRAVPSSDEESRAASSGLKARATTSLVWPRG